MFWVARNSSSSLAKCNVIGMINQQLRLKNTKNKNTADSSSSSSSSSDDEPAKKPSRPPKSNEKEKALNKLNSLLAKMVKEDAETKAEEKKINLAKPISKRKSSIKTELQTETAKPKATPEEKLLESVKNVAKIMGGDAESELLSKLLQPIDAKPTNLNDLMKGMQIDRENKNENTRAEQVRQILSATNQSNRYPKQATATTRGKGSQLNRQKVDLFGADPLGVFTSQAEAAPGVANPTWERLQRHELRLATTHPPRNYFQQMIRWTDEGKVWKFPIDNEQGMEAEQSVSFVEHVFLERHLEAWCPRRGPLRHFMELVCVGLSKNPYLTVDAKKEHIDWFRKYFDGKKQLLQDVGALEQEAKPKKLDA